MMRYKAQWFHRTVVEVGQFYASSILCIECGYRNGMLKLSDRQWTCPRCGAVHDRDTNAARNILTEGLRLLNNKSLPLSSGKVRHADGPTADDKAVADATAPKKQRPVET